MSLYPLAWLCPACNIILAHYSNVPGPTLHSIHMRVSRRKSRYAIASSVQTASFTAYALMLGYSIQKHNDLAAMDAEMVLMVREGGTDGITKENRTSLEAAGWNVKVVSDLNFKGVDNSKIRAQHRHNMNKLLLWSWTEYEKILFIDADVVCKGSLKDLWDVPGGKFRDQRRQYKHRTLRATL